MKVLMFGWEFPPHISGGLGTACYRMTEALVKRNVNILFVVPKKYQDTAQNGSRIIGADCTDVHISDIDKTKEIFKTVQQSLNLSFIQVNSLLVPYIGQRDYYNITSRNFEELKGHYARDFHNSVSMYRRFDFSGGYTENLMEEVDKYAVVAA